MINTSCLRNLNPELVGLWQEQMALVVNTPTLLPDGIRDDDKLLPRFAAYYRQLKALPRRLRRRLQRQWHLPLAGVALMLALGQSPALAATIQVGGPCTLVDAITAANTDSATGGCPAGSGADTIVLPVGSTQTLTAVNNEIYGPTGLPVVSSVITIAGNGSMIVRDSAAPEFRLAAVSPVGDLRLYETTVSGGVTFVGAARNEGGGVLNDGTLTVINSTIANNMAAGVGGGVVSDGTLTVINSTIANNKLGGGLASGGTLTVINSLVSGNDGAAGAVTNFGTFTVMNSTISGNFMEGVYNSGTGTIANSTIAGNSVYSQFYGRGGAVANHYGGTLTIANSTITGNSVSFDYFGVGGGGVFNDYGGTLTIANSTITGNFIGLGGHPVGAGGGVANFHGTLTLTRTLVSGNGSSFGYPPEIKNLYDGTVIADNHNLFGVDGNAGVEGFTPGPTDIVPAPGVQLSQILNPTLAFNGGPTQTHALVPGSPAIDAGGTDCLDANGVPLATDQRGKPRIIDGNGDGTAACDIGAFEFFPVVNNLVTLDPALDTSFDPTPVPGAPAGTFTIGATFTNTSSTPLRFPFFTVTELSDGNLLLNAEEGAQGVGATVTPDVGDQVLSPGETVQVDFVVGLQTATPFTFFVDLFGEPVISGSPTSRPRPKVATKGSRR